MGLTGSGTLVVLGLVGLVDGLNRSRDVLGEVFGASVDEGAVVTVDCGARTVSGALSVPGRNPGTCRSRVEVAGAFSRVAGTEVDVVGAVARVVLLERESVRPQSRTAGVEEPGVGRSVFTVARS